MVYRKMEYIYIVILTILVCLISLTGCKKTNYDDIQHLDSGNTHGYYFDLFTESTRNVPRDGIIGMENYNDELIFRVENASQPRQFAVQFFLNYEQVPVIIDSIVYETFIIDADAYLGNEYTFSLLDEIDTSYNHSLVVVLIAGADILTSETDFRITDHYSIAYNSKLSFNENNHMKKSQYQYEETEVVTEYQGQGLILNTDTVNFARLVPNKELNLMTGEKFSLHYQVGGYKDCEDVAIFITIGLKQANINNQDYIICKLKNGELVSGIIEIIAPDIEGEYEIMGWVVKDPFNDKHEFFPLDSSYRFTLNVK